MKKFGDFKKALKKHHSEVLKFIQKAEIQAAQAGNEKLLKLIQKEKNTITQSVDALDEKSKGLYPDFQTELKKRTGRLEKKIESLTKATETLTSDNYLLEYKKMDLLHVTNKLEEAYDEISLKNNELMHQQKMIAEQTEKLNDINEKILEKNRELELQKEALMDQSDYLHEANQTITYMHAEVEKRKNEILQKNDELLTLNNEKNNLIGIVAHDLKSPLNQIKGLLTIMKMSASNFSEETMSYIDMMEKSAARLSDMIAKILDVEAIESKNLNLVLENINLSDVLNNIADRYLIAAEKKSLAIERSIPASVSAFVDRSYVDQVFENLVSNAIKFSPSNKKLFINLSQVDGKVIGEIRDEGPGLTEDDKKKLFGKYQKLSARPTGNETSTGLGLSIVKKFVEAMGGEIWCESVSGKGASFFVSFPFISVDSIRKL
jgi:signal transduction histidine kinase